MKTIQRLTLCALFALGSLYASAYDFKSSGIYYNIVSSDELTCEVTYENNTSYNSYSGSITIPETVINSNKTYTVVRVGDYAFRDCSSLAEITIPNSIISIGYYAFGHCSSLTEVTIPNSVTSIGNYGFYYCESLTNVTIPESVTSIGYDAFSYCTSLISISLPNSLTEIGEYAFYRCSSLTDVTIPNGVAKIEDYTFEYCEKLSSVVLGSSVERLRGCVFRFCGALIKLYSLNQTPPICSTDTFSSNISKCVLYVPEEAVEAYSVAPAWRDFYDIQGIETNGIETLTPNGTEIVGYYGIDGKQLNTPQRGLNIVRYSDGTTNKVMKK